MKTFKSSIILASVLGVALVGANAALADGVAYGSASGPSTTTYSTSNSSVVGVTAPMTATGNAVSPLYVTTVPTATAGNTTTGTAATGNQMPTPFLAQVNGQTWSFPAGWMSNTGAQVAMTTSTMYPGVPNTGGASVGTATTVTSNGTVYNSVPGYGTVVANGQTSVAGFRAPNGTFVNFDANGMIRLIGTVSTITPGAIAITANGTQTWTVVTKSGATFSSVGLAAGDVVEITGSLDQTYMSQIDATTIRNITRNSSILSM